MKPCGVNGHGPQCGCDGKLNSTVRSDANKYGADRRYNLHDKILADNPEEIPDPVSGKIKEWFNKNFNNHSKGGSLGPPKILFSPTLKINYGAIENRVMAHLARGCDVDICIKLAERYPYPFVQFRDSFFWLDDWLKDKHAKASTEFREFIVQSGAEYAIAMAVDLAVGVRENTLYQEKRGRLAPWSSLKAKEK